MVKETVRFVNWPGAKVPMFVHVNWPPALVLGGTLAETKVKLVAG